MKTAQVDGIRAAQKPLDDFAKLGAVTMPTRSIEPVWIDLRREYGQVSQAEAVLQACLFKHRSQSTDTVVRFHRFTSGPNVMGRVSPLLRRAKVRRMANKPTGMNSQRWIGRCV